jgi:hypothetical protein
MIDSQKLVRDLIKGNLKRAPSYFSELENLTYDELLKAALTNPRARKMLKLIKQSDRLQEKLKQKGK